MDSRYRVVYIVSGLEEVITGFFSLRSASDEAWHLRSLGLVAWAESVA